MSLVKINIVRMVNGLPPLEPENLVALAEGEVVARLSAGEIEQDEFSEYTAVRSQVLKAVPIREIRVKPHIKFKMAFSFGSWIFPVEYGVRGTLGYDYAVHLIVRPQGLPVITLDSGL
jgi:hypothetical protein